MISHNNIALLSDIKNSSSEASTLEEAKQIINLKNLIVLKLKNYVANALNVVGTGSGSGDQQNLIDYLKYENDRLESKLLLMQNEVGVEKTRSEQIKEVIFLMLAICV